MSRILTTIVQIILLVAVIQLTKLTIKDIKENGFQFSNPEQDLKLLHKNPEPLSTGLSTM